MSCAPVVVVGLASVVGLQTARIFAARGIPVIGVAGDLGHFAARTRVCERIITADVFTDDVVDRLESLGPELTRRAVLIPCTDKSTLIISKGRDRLERWYDVPLGSYDSLLSLSDKGRFADAARSLGLDVPATVLLRSRHDAERAAGRLRYPVVLKPTLKSSSWEQRAGGKVLTIDGADALMAQYDRLRPWTTQFVVQEFVGGPDAELFTVNGYFSDGVPLAMFTTRKHRQWPPRTGIASFAREERNDEIVDAAERIFGANGYTGLGYLEAKRDPVTRRLRLIEANVGRPTGRSATAEAGGVELLMTMYCDASGLPLPKPHQRRQRYVGASWLDLRRDVLAGVHGLRRGEVTPGQLLTDWFGPRTTHAVLSWHDPLPFVVEVLQSLTKVVRRLQRRLGSRLGAGRGRPSGRPVWRPFG